MYFNHLIYYKYIQHKNKLNKFEIQETKN